MTGQLMSRTSRRAGLGGLVAALVVLGLAVPAWAYLSVSSTTAIAAGRAATLGIPSATTSNVSSSSVTINVTAPPSGPTPTGYRVARTSPSPVTSVCTVTGVNGSCTDTAPVAGQTNNYAVYAVLSGTSWESPAPGATSATVPSADTTAPVTTATQSPAANGAGWNKTDVTVTLSATDASGVAGTWYTTDGSVPTTSSTPYLTPFTVSSTTTVRFFSKDTLGNTEQAKSSTVQIDKIAPTVSISSPTSGSINGGVVTITGSATDGGSSLLASVVVQYRYGTTVSQIGGSPTYNGSNWSWSWPTSSLPEGSYTLVAIARDNADNGTVSTEVPITLKNTFTVTAPSSATAGTPFNVTVSTYPGYTGAKPITVTGLQASPSGDLPSVPTNVVFTNGTATFAVTAVKSGSQSITVTDSTVASMTGSASVAVSPSQTTRLAWFNLAINGTSSSCIFTCNATLANGNGSVGSRVSLTDTYGNLVTNTGAALNVTVSSGGGADQTSLTIVSGASTSAGGWTFSQSGNGNPNKTFTAVSGGLASPTVKVTR